MMDVDAVTSKVIVLSKFDSKVPGTLDTKPVASAPTACSVVVTVTVGGPAEYVLAKALFCLSMPRIATIGSAMISGSVRASAAMATSKTMRCFLLYLCAVSSMPSKGCSAVL